MKKLNLNLPVNSDFSELLNTQKLVEISASYFDIFKQNLPEYQFKGETITIELLSQSNNFNFQKVITFKNVNGNPVKHINNYLKNFIKYFRIIGSNFTLRLQIDGNYINDSIVFNSNLRTKNDAKEKFNGAFLLAVIQLADYFLLDENIDSEFDSLLS